MNKVIVNRGQGGLGRQPLGQDFISGFIFYGSAGTLSALGWTSGTVKKFGGIQDAINAGITNNHIYETKATGLLTLSEPATAGLTVIVTINGPINGSTVLCTYATVSGDVSSATIFATNLTAAINAQTYITGFTAVASTDTVDITAAPGLGASFNNISTPIVISGTAMTDVTITSQLGVGTAGVGSECDNFYYHINRYFTQSPNATLYVSITTTPSWSAYTFPEIGLIQTGIAAGSVRQCGIFIPNTFATATVTAIQAQVNTLIAANQPMSVIIGADFSASQASTLVNLRTLNSEHVSVSVGQDGAAQGNTLFYAYGKSITQVGDILGLTSLSQVSDSIAWPGGGYNLAIDGIENAVPAFATTVGGSGVTPELVSNITAGTIASVDSYAYIFGTQFVNNSPNGTFVNNPYTCTLSTSDYEFIPNCRTIDKAARQLYAAYVEELASPLVVQANGTLSNGAVAFFEGVGEDAISGMASNNPNTGRPELSGYTVTINPNQNVLSTSQLLVSVALQPIGFANEIVINLQFAVTL